MRKILIILIFLSLSFFIWVYFFVPAQLNIDESVLVKSNKNTVNRGLNDMALWKQWWPDTMNNRLSYDGIIYQPQLPGLYAFAVKVTDITTGYKTILSIVESNRDSVLLTWKGAFSTGSNPFTRISRYRQIKKLAGDMKDILKKKKKFMSNPRNVYGIIATNEIVKDTLLLNTHAIFSHIPSTDKTYALINKLIRAAHDAGATVTGYPMINITQGDSSGYLLRVALPVNKPVQEENGIVIKRMIPGNILVSNNIAGGTGTVEHAFKQMMNYARDLNKTSPAIPFQSLITNRQIEKDSTKWITRIYCPVY